MQNQLTSAEQKRYLACKEQIRTGLQTVFDTGAALAEIRDKKLYRDEYDTFEQFCQQTYKIGRAHAYRMIEAAKIENEPEISRKSLSESKILSPIGDKITNEAQARELSKVPERIRPVVLAQAASSGAVTAASIATAAKKIIDVEEIKTSNKQVEEQLDKTGWPIPQKIQAEWDAAAETARVQMNLVSKMKSAFEDAQERKTPMFNEVVISAAVGACKSLYGDWKIVLPFAVCPVCQGKAPDKCGMCKRRGYVSEFFWNRCVAKEQKDMREKILKSR
jgi:hypothetical protein